MPPACSPGSQPALPTTDAPREGAYAQDPEGEPSAPAYTTPEAQLSEEAARQLREEGLDRNLLNEVELRDPSVLERVPAATWLNTVPVSCAGGDVHIVVDAIAYLRDGLVSSMTYGDDLRGRRPTVSTTTYDVRRRPVRMTTVRDNDGAVSSSDDDMLRVVQTVVDQQLVWDAANNLTGTIDHRDAAEWPAGHRPQTTHIRHDALYRVVQADFDYTQPDGLVAPNDLGTDWRDRFDDAIAHDPMY